MSERDISRRSFIGGAAAIGAAVAMPGLASARGGGGTVVLITGTSSGFGRLSALTLARGGHRVVASMRDLRTRNAGAARELERIARAERLALDTVELDVRSERSVESGVAQALRRHGRIDVLVNNAGTFYPALLETQTPDDLHEVFETNVYGHMRVSRAVLPSMRERSDGLVIQVTSALGRIVLPFQGAYTGAKWALEALTQTLRYELARLGVDVAIVEPAAYPTDLIDNARRSYARYLRELDRGDARRRREYGALAREVEQQLVEEGPDPQQVADAIARLIATPRGSRPLRTLVGEQVQGLAPINDAQQAVQQHAIPEDMQGV